MPEEKNKAAKNAPKYLTGMTLGWNMAVGMAFFSLIGYYIDQKTATEQFWTLIGIFLGLFYCGYEVWKMIRTMNEKEKK